jgi:hypothetical protein
MTATAQATATAGQPNRFAGPCIVCSTHVPARAGVVRKIASTWRVYCSRHDFGGPGDSDAASNGPPASAPAGDAPRCSERAAMAAIALVRHAVDDKRAPADAVDIAIELATLAVWRCGSAEAARDLAGALPRQASPEHDAAAVDLVGEILGRAHIVSDADANRIADELAPRVDGPVARAYVTTPAPKPATKRERSTKGAGRWAHRKGN